MTVFPLSLNHYYLKGNALVYAGPSMRQPYITKLTLSYVFLSVTNLCNQKRTVTRGHRKLHPTPAPLRQERPITMIPLSTGRFQFMQICCYPLWHLISCWPFKPSSHLPVTIDPYCLISSKTFFSFLLLIVIVLELCFGLFLPKSPVTPIGSRDYLSLAGCKYKKTRSREVSCNWCATHERRHPNRGGASHEL